jgi:lysyl-tRNA synthetase class 1
LRRIIGRGTWIDKVASKVLERERILGRGLSHLRVESGLGASGIPHVGSLSDALRAYGIKLALEDQGYSSELIAFSDDMDGLRKVPAGLPKDLKRYIAHPVSRIPDPFSCHSSYGEHMGSLLREALDKIGVEYTFKSGAKAYKEGLLLEQARKVLINSRRIGEKIAELTGQEKFVKALPYFVICPRCGKIYTTEALSYEPPTDVVHFRCKGAQIGGRWVEGCGYEGDVKLSEGEGKLSWKVEFASRWAALDIRFEAYGKDIADSVKINDWVAENILQYPPPYHVRYEMFLDKSGRKISKSAGNVFTPQVWFRYGTKESLVLLMFKRIVGTRSLSVEDIPKYMDEYDWLEDVYFGRVKVEEAKRVKLKGLYEYVHFLNPPKKPKVHIPYRLLAELAYAAPEEDVVGFVLKRLRTYRMVKEDTEGLEEKIALARNWAKEIMGSPKPVSLNEVERYAVKELAEFLEKNEEPDVIQNAIFEIARRNGIKPPAFFNLLYRIFLGMDRGPRLGPYIADIGVKRAAEILYSALKEPPKQG